MSSQAPAKKTSIPFLTEKISAVTKYVSSAIVAHSLFFSLITCGPSGPTDSNTGLLAVGRWR